MRRSTSIPSARYTLLICVSLVALTLALFLRAVWFPFITYDDELYVADNAHVLTGLHWSNVVWAFRTWHTGNWHPFTWVSLMADACFFGKNAGGYHFTSLLLHVVNSVVLFFVLRGLTGAQWRSAFVAALFAVHPLHVESVVWVSERKDLLSTLFFLLSLGAYRHYVNRPRPARYALVTLFFLFGLLSKSMLVTLPFLLLVLDFWPLRRWVKDVDLRSLLREKVPLFALAAIFSVLTFFAQKSVGATVPTSVYPLGVRLANSLLSYARYLGKIFWPHDLILPYPFSRSISSLELCWAAGLLVGLTFLAIKTARRRGYLFTGWFWFVGTLVPVIGVIQVGPQAMADRYMYIPATGIFLGTTWAFVDVTATMRLPAYINGVLAATALVVLSCLSFVQIDYWKNSETLFQHSLTIHPGEIVALRNLATDYENQHRPREAIACLESLLPQTPDDPAVHFHLGQALQEIGQQRRAVSEYESALRLSRDRDKYNVTGSALNNLAWIRATSPDPALRDGTEAVRLAERSCQLTPEPDAAQVDTLAAAYAETGDFQRATDTAMRALQLAESARNEPLRGEISKHVDLFRRQMPYHQAKP